MKVTKKEFEKAKKALESQKIVDCNLNNFVKIKEQILENFDKIKKMKQTIILIAKKGDLKECYKNKFIFKDDDVFNKNNELLLNINKKNLCYKKDVYKYFLDDKELSKNAFIIVNYFLQSLNKIKSY